MPQSRTRILKLSHSLYVHVYQLDISQLSGDDFAALVGCSGSEMFKNVPPRQIINAIRNLAIWYHGRPDNNHTYWQVRGPFTSAAKAEEAARLFYAN